MVKKKINDLQTDLSNTKQTLATTQSELSSTKSTLAKTETDLKKTKQQLADANNERDAAVAKADAADKTAKKATDDLAALNAKSTRIPSSNFPLTRTAASLPNRLSHAAKTIKDLNNTITATRAENRLLGLNKPQADRGTGSV